MDDFAKLRSERLARTTMAGRRIINGRTAFPRQVVCPTCLAQRGEFCRTKDGRQRGPHTSRMKAWTDLLVDEAREEANIVVLQLRTASTEIATEGHAGWGNACLDAADLVESLSAQVAESDRLAEYANKLCDEWQLRAIAAEAQVAELKKDAPVNISIMQQFCGWLSTDIRELHPIEVPRLQDSLERFLASAAKESGVSP